MKLAVAGCSGRMGATLMRLIAQHPEATLAGGTERAEALASARAMLAQMGKDDALITEDISAMLAQADGIIDFTTPQYSLEIARVVAGLGKVHVCGTTGFSAEQQKALASYGGDARLVWAPNMSVCVNLFMGLVEQSARALGEDFDIEVLEMHHGKKQDAPSGTALALGKAAARGRGLEFERAAVRVRDGITGERKKETIGFAALRGGDVVGDHTVFFAGMGERLELTHRATSREIYARGALRAALWAQSQKPGYYSMKDVLGL